MKKNALILILASLLLFNVTNVAMANNVYDNVENKFSDTNYDSTFS